MALSCTAARHPLDTVPNSTAHGAQVISLVPFGSLYVRKLDGKDRPRAPYVNDLARALEWAAEHAHALRMHTVQLSAIDGLYEDGPDTYARLVPVEHRRFQRAVAALGERGVWVSAPSGNDARLPGMSAWPASEPGVVGVGCADKLGRPIKHRSGRTTLLMSCVDGHYTSNANVNVCGVVIAVRDALQHACGLRRTPVVPPSALLELLLQTARRSAADPISKRSYPIVDPRALFARIGNATRADPLCHMARAAARVEGGGATISS